MNDKASVSKELNAQHAKILLGLLKLPENKECADCKSKGPRWASINLGIFICLRCSGIHRSLGVHISKVRSTTLDIWLPDQVAFMQAMGNQKANSYWEADLPVEFYRSPIETFIYAKYVDKRWASTTSPQPNPDEIISSISFKKEIPKKARRYSLDEEIFIKKMPLLAPPTPSTHHSRAESLSLMDSAPPPLISFDKSLSSSSTISRSKTTNKDTSAAAAGGTGTDLFSLLYVSEETQDRTVVPPSRWATFDDCKNLQLSWNNFIFSE